MKEILNELGYKDKPLPKLSEFVKVWHESYMYMIANISDLINYTDFITQPLTKGMFVPCDEEGNVLVEPSVPSQAIMAQVSREKYPERLKQYQQALDKVLFDGWGVDSHTDLVQSKRLVQKTDNGTVAFIYGEGETLEQAINNGVKLYLR